MIQKWYLIIYNIILITYIYHYYVETTGFIGSNFNKNQQINSTTILTKQKQKIKKWHLMKNYNNLNKICLI